MIWTPRPKGHVRDIAPHPAAVHVSALVGAASGSADLATIRLPATIDFQQGQDCTGSYGKLVETWCAARGIPCEPISRRFTYTLGREIAIADPAAALVDEGAFPAQVVEGMRQVGVVPETLCPGDGADVINERLTFDMLQHAAVWRASEIAIIPESGAVRCSLIRAALAAQYPVGFGMSVDQAYEDLVGETVYTGPTGPSLGGHAQRIVGCAPGKFLIGGSWPRWAAAGFAWIADSVIGDDALTYDFYALHFAPAVHE